MNDQLNLSHDYKNFAQYPLSCFQCFLDFLKSNSYLSKKVPFTCSRESPLKMMTNAFYLILEALFVLKISNDFYAETFFFFLLFVCFFSERERELSKLPESTEGKSMDKDTFFIMKNNLRLLLQENTLIYKKFLLSCEPVSASQFLYSVP